MQDVFGYLNGPIKNNVKNVLIGHNASIVFVEHEHVLHAIITISASLSRGSAARRGFLAAHPR
jgi:hypothetical protein